MTAQSAAESPVEPSDQTPVEPVDEAQPLSAYVRGTLSLHFDGGAVVTRRAAQLDARAFLNKQKDAEESDEVTWNSRRWFTWASEHVVYSAFDADIDQNWEITPRDRRHLAFAGHPHGVIASLVRFWERRGRRDEPMYSPRVVVGLYFMALDGVGRRAWEVAARVFEGTDGAAHAARDWADFDRGPMPETGDAGAADPSEWSVHDDAEPEQADADSQDSPQPDPAATDAESEGDTSSADDIATDDHDA